MTAVGGLQRGPERELGAGEVVEGEQRFAAVVLEMTDDDRLLAQRLAGSFEAAHRFVRLVPPLVHDAEVDVRPRRQ